ncbi:apolipoprotein N-acyltransferase [Francisella noatunensis]|uniref:Apolipoprotein N-acyltransferase n=1 Tax=Francisella noatunensis TaxID=657445 RepID=A0A9Q2KUV7_9GAMM|nr:apolipoprotein N-acyltransferase [Francisella noatunensis]MBK2028241.1 apolipoprotein N-acyltransferase [Francisella noatunensis]MBK2033575.1 apolipoprotein N-acyltransferase [Francisella noatunensis]MBK2048472.1 apolipoprotein N-acyltransferase [Francisella noatunensis]MBK2049952.1 apolipoprotein N-acyltransferase [Francisella noatunensis]MBK2050887.1 apolipoprotein N-acyltransferase [Francisella noatunensis]
MKKIILKIAPPVLSGAVLTLAFAPFRIDVLAVVALVAFFYLLNRSVRIRDAFFTSVLFGIGFFGTSISWVYISIHLFTESVAAGLSAAIALVILLSFLHIIPFGIFSHILTRKANNFSKLLIYPALWTLFEIVKANLLWGGFPWVSLGYSQTESPLIWYANIGGVYLVSYIIALIACLIVFFICDNTSTKKTISVAAIILTLYLGGYLIKHYQPEIQTNQPQKVVLIQGDFVQGFKWDRDNFAKMQKYYQQAASKYKDSLIILSENAIPNYRQLMSEYFRNLTESANKNNNAMLIGSLSADQSTAGTKIYNSSIIIGKGEGVYNKYHLVPFGEYFPIKFFGYVDSVGLSSFNAGDNIQPIMTAFGSPVANFICYEVAYPEQVRDQLQEAKLISIISDDSWFGNSIAREQQLQISQVRAIENNKYVLTTTSNGITAVINSDGVIVKELPKNTRASLEQTVYLNDYHSIWMKIGMTLIFGLIILSLVVGIILKEITKKASL